MTLDQAAELIRTTAQRMNELYGKVVFDELAVVAVVQHKVYLLRYTGHRLGDFQTHFLEDTKELRDQLRANKYNIGDFEFARHGYGTKAEAFVVVGDDIYLICNHTSRSMTQISEDPLWLSAQVPFVEMSDRFRSDPLIHPL